MKTYKKWKASHQLTDIKAGDKIDIRDTEYIWCVGTVELKITTQNHPPVLYIHYEVIISDFIGYCRVGIENMMNIFMLLQAD